MNAMREWVRTYGAARGRAYVIKCAGCGREDQTVQDFGPDKACELLPKKFAAKGWQVGKGPKTDYCETCVRKFKAIAARKKEAQMSNVTPIKLDPLPLMTKQDRRVIFSKLEEVYLDELTGYSGGWNDIKVATDLGVSVAWVADVREQNFGPNQSETTVRLLKEGSDALIAARALRQAIDERMQELKEESTKIDLRLSKLEKDLSALNRGAA